MAMMVTTATKTTAFSVAHKSRPGKVYRGFSQAERPLISPKPENSPRGYKCHLLFVREIDDFEDEGYIFPTNCEEDLTSTTSLSSSTSSSSSFSSLRSKRSRPSESDEVEEKNVENPTRRYRSTFEEKAKMGKLGRSLTSNRPSASRNQPVKTSRSLSSSSSSSQQESSPESVNFVQGRRYDEVQDQTSSPTLVQTISGGTNTIFEMARQMLIWDQEQERGSGLSSSGGQAAGGMATLPRWHPVSSGISDLNPRFRTQSPAMNNQGYAGTIWRNVRKRQQPAMWRYALRTFDRMDDQEQQTTGTTNGSLPQLRVERTNIHYEGALLACAKLGLWQRALSIYQQVEEKERQLRAKLQLQNSAGKGGTGRASSNDTGSLGQPKESKTVGAAAINPNNMNNGKKRKIAVYVTDNMITCLIGACTRASRQMARTLPMEQRRKPLDVALQIADQMESKHGLPLVARHINPLAAAYQELGLLEEAQDLLRTRLRGRTSGPEPERGSQPFNVHDVGAKDKASYALLVKGAVARGDWGEAVDALWDMTEAGLYPTGRHLNVWTELSERKTRHRHTRSWKKKRDESWMEHVLIVQQSSSPPTAPPSPTTASFFESNQTQFLANGSH